MFIKSLLSACCFVLMFVSVAPVIANPSADALVEQFKSVKTFKADFKQTVTNKQAGSKEQTSGSIVLKGEKQFRLEYMRPYKQVYVADGKYMWFYDEDLEQVTVRLQNDKMADTPALILSQPERFIKQYQVTRVQEAGEDIYTLFTTSEQTAFDKIYLRFKNNKLLRMTMFDNFGSETRLDFTNLHYNMATNDNTFTFVVPKGVDVIRQFPEAGNETE